MLRSLLAPLSLSAIALASCAPQLPPSPLPPEGTPRLVLHIVIDQARSDYLTRFAPYFSEGLARLLAESIDFRSTSHNHATTNTAPGHATLSTGSHPARHGIVGNSWYDRELGDSVEVDEDSDYSPDRAPTRLLVPTLGDWMKSAHHESKVFAASMKSRAAIMSGGHSANAAFWYDDETGRFISSDYYPWSSPGWLESFHQNPMPDRMFGAAWEAHPKLDTAATELGLEEVNVGITRGQLPRPVGPSTTELGESYYWRFRGEAPFGDAYLADLAWALIEHEGLGEDAYPDLLALSFSSLDYIGHDFGPNSPEILDTLLRLDQTLGDLLDRLDVSLGLENVVISLTSDHGVAEIPEYSGARRFWVEERTCLQKASRALDTRFGPADWLESDLVLNRDTLEEMSIDLEKAEKVMAEAIEACPGVEHVWTASEIASRQFENPYGELYAHGFHADRSDDLIIQVERGALTSTGETSHGTVYAYDRNVPWLLRLPSKAPRTVYDPVFTTDIAPTLAETVGVTPTAEIDGESRVGLLASAAPENNPMNDPVRPPGPVVAADDERTD